MPDWVKDEDKWNDAKKAFKKSYDKEPKTDKDWVIVTAIYKKMDGKIENIEQYLKEFEEYCFTEARTVDGYESPEPGDIPEKAKQILAATYASCRKDGGDKTKCSKIAWGAVKNAGYKPESKENFGDVTMESYKEKLDKLHESVFKEAHYFFDTMNDIVNRNNFDKSKSVNDIRRELIKFIEVNTLPVDINDRKLKQYVDDLIKDSGM